MRTLRNIIYFDRPQFMRERGTAYRGYLLLGAIDFQANNIINADNEPNDCYCSK